MKKNQTLTSRIRTFLLVLLVCTMTGNVQARPRARAAPTTVKGWKPRRRLYFNPRSLAGATLLYL